MSLNILYAVIFGQRIVIPTVMSLNYCMFVFSCKWLKSGKLLISLLPFGSILLCHHQLCLLHSNNLYWTKVQKVLLNSESIALLNFLISFRQNICSIPCISCIYWPFIWVQISCKFYTLQQVMALFLYAKDIAFPCGLFFLFIPN